MNTNKHLLDTKLKSIAHYNSELQRLTEAANVTNSTKGELLKSLAEFFPFEDGDILLKDGRIYRVSIGAALPLTVDEDSSGPIFRVWLFDPDTRGSKGWVKNGSFPSYIRISDFDKYKVIANTETMRP
jgi:hypothetical protein